MSEAKPSGYAGPEAPRLHQDAGLDAPRSTPHLVLLHGLTGSPAIWDPVLAPLERAHDVFVPALAGHAGGPPLEPVDGGIPALADAMERTLDAAGIERAHIVGSSLGGWLALELARRDRAESVVALSPAGGWRNARDIKRVVRMFTMGEKGLQSQHARIVKLLRRPGMRRLVMRNTMEHGERVPLAAAVAMIEDAVATTVVLDFLRWVSTAAKFDGAGLEHVPVRIAWGERDRVIPFKAYGQPLHDALPHAEQVSLPSCGHVPMYDDPDLVVRTILQVTKERDERRVRV